MECRCGHYPLFHVYLSLIGDNSGACLIKNCGCEIYQEGDSE